MPSDALFEFHYRWDQLAGNLANKEDELEARDAALEQFIRDFSCGGSCTDQWFYDTELSALWPSDDAPLSPFTNYSSSSTTVPIGAVEYDSFPLGPLLSAELSATPSVEVFGEYGIMDADTLDVLMFGSITSTGGSDSFAATDVPPGTNVKAYITVTYDTPPDSLLARVLWQPRIVTCTEPPVLTEWQLPT